MAPRLFNTLPSEIRDFEGIVNAFKIKGRLDKFFMKIPDKPVIKGYTQPSASNSIIDQMAALRKEVPQLMNIAKTVNQLDLHVRCQLEVYTSWKVAWPGGATCMAAVEDQLKFTE